MYLPGFKTANQNMWNTPREMFRELDREFIFTLDPCCSAESALCEKFYTPEKDGLTQDWAGERVFMNPPYGKEAGRWVAKAYQESQRGALVVCLLQAATDLPWFHDYCLPYGEIRFIRGRVKYASAGRRKRGAPWPSMIVIFDPEEPIQ